MITSRDGKPLLAVENLHAFLPSPAGHVKAVDGISAGLAQKVYDFFHEKG